MSGESPLQFLQRALLDLKWDFSPHDLHDKTNICKLFLGILALKTHVQLHLNQDALDSLLDLLAKQKITQQAWSEEPTRNFQFPTDANFLSCLGNISSLSAIQVDNWYSQVHTCLVITNSIIAHKSEPAVTDSVALLNRDSERYIIGNIRLKERHTYIYESSIGPIQIGIPPETIKTSLIKGEPVPQIYILPPTLFVEDANFGEIEFPIYFNFFIKKAFANPDNRVVIIGKQEHLSRVRTIFHESIYGPSEDNLFLHEEIAPEKKATGYSIDLVKELRYFAIKTPDGAVASLEHFASFVPFDDQGTAVVKKAPTSATVPVELKILNDNGLVRFFEDGVLKAALDTTIYPGWTRDIQKELKLREDHPVTEFQPPTLGVTFLGTSHGFDEKGHTTGFIIWINGRGIVVDPPVYTTEYLQLHKIKRSMVDQVILTHCHSDHDSGLLKKIVGGERLQLFTTKTIHESYKRKIAAATGLKFDMFYDFVPVPIGKPFKILGATFEFDYSLHAIPTLRFKLNFAGRSISYSSDTLFDPKSLSELRNSGIISSEREMSLRMFVFDADLIIHESGVPPIHTPAAVLNDLPSSVKKKMVIVHCHYLPQKVEKRLPNGENITVPVTDLKIPKCGLENTISLPVSLFHEGYSLCSRRFQMLSDVFFFQKLSSSIVSELLTYLDEFSVPGGTTIIRSGELSDTFFVIEKGEVNVLGVNDEQLNVLSAGDAFGENALRSSRQIPRSASVVARTDCNLLKVPASVFHAIVQKDHNIQEIRIDYDVSKVTKNRSFVAGVLARTYLFQNLPIEQINALAAVLEEEQNYNKDSVLICQGDRDTSLFIIKEGSVRLERTDEQGLPRVLIDHIGVGQVVGELALITALPRTASVVCNEDCVVIELRKPAFDHLLNKFQNINVKLSQLVEQRIKENQRIEEQLRTPRKALSASVLEVTTNE